jgi:hypothetical protein
MKLRITVASMAVLVSCALVTVVAGPALAAPTLVLHEPGGGSDLSTGATVGAIVEIWPGNTRTLECEYFQPGTITKTGGAKTRVSLQQREPSCYPGSKFALSGEFASLSINSQGLVTLAADKADRPRIVDGACTYELPPKMYVMVTVPGLASEIRAFTAGLVPKGSGLACTLGASFSMGFDLIGEEQILFTEVLG